MNKKNSGFSGIIALSLFMLVPSLSYAGLDFLKPAKIPETIRKEVAKASVGASLNIVDTEVFDGLSAALKYRIQSEPSYVDGFYTRLDRYTFTTDLRPGDLIEDNDYPLGFSIRKNTEIIFARQFKSQKESLLSLPYTFKHIPLTAHKALNNLNPGDFISFQANLSLILSLGASSALSPTLDLSGSTHAYVSGEFMVHLFRMPKDRIRMKLMAIRENGKGANASVELGNFDIFGINVIDRQIRKWVRIKPLSMGMRDSNNDLFLVDYVFSLNDPQATQIYDDIMSQKATFKSSALLNPFISREKMQSVLLTDLTDADEMATADLDRQQIDRRIDRVFKGSNRASGYDNSFKIGLNIFKFESGNIYSQNKVVHIDRQNVEHKYLLDTYSVINKSSFIFNFFGHENIMTTNLIFSADDNFVPKTFEAMTLSREIKLPNLSARDFQKIQKHVKRIIPADEYAKIPWQSWNFSRGKKVNGLFKNEIFFHPEALGSVPAMTEAELKTKLKAFILKAGKPLAPPKYPLPYENNNGPWIFEYMIDIQNVAHNLYIVLGPGHSSSDRYESFKKIKDIGLWQENAAGFLLSMLPRDRLGDLISYQMVMSAKDAETIRFQFGKFEREELYKSLMYIQNVINNRSFDLRLLMDEKGEFRLQ